MEDHPKFVFEKLIYEIDFLYKQLKRFEHLYKYNIQYYLESVQNTTRVYLKVITNRLFLI